MMVLAYIGRRDILGAREDGGDVVVQVGLQRPERTGQRVCGRADVVRNVDVVQAGRGACLGAERDHRLRRRPRCASHDA